jgi:hypothetical protein
MIMVSDMFNNTLKAKIDGLCAERSQLLAEQPVQPSSESVPSQGTGQQQQQNALGALFSPRTSGFPSGQW